MVMKTMHIAALQHPDKNGVRHSSHLFVRGSAGDLLRGVVRTFEQRVHSDVLTIRKSSPIGGTIRMLPLNDQNQNFPETCTVNGKVHPYMLGGYDTDKEEFFDDAINVSGQRIGDMFPQGTFVNAIVDFVPLDNTEWEAMLLGTEYTCVNFDEPDSMSNIHEVLPKMPTRVGRYPAAEIAPITCSQINLAYNPPKKKCFTEKFFSKQNEKYGRKLYRMQPPYLITPDKKDPNNFFKASFRPNPDREGIYAAKGLKHWGDIIDSSRHDPDKIRRDVLGEYTTGSSGRLVHLSYNPAIHCVPEIQLSRNLRLIVSLDWGNKGHCLFAQYAEGVRVVEELSGNGIPAYEFVRNLVLPHIRVEYRSYDIIVTGDPSGRYQTNSGEGPFMLFEDAGYETEKYLSNDPEDRWSAVDHFLNLHGGLEIDENCVDLLEGLEGGYVFRTNKAGESLRSVDKTKHVTAPQDCLQAICQLVLGGFETGSNNSWQATDPYDKQQTNYQEEEILWV
jgi:hypothetical protein